MQQNVDMAKKDSQYDIDMKSMTMRSQLKSLEVEKLQFGDRLHQLKEAQKTGHFHKLESLENTKSQRDRASVVSNVIDRKTVGQEDPNNVSGQLFISTKEKMYPIISADQTFQYIKEQQASSKHADEYTSEFPDMHKGQQANEFALDEQFVKE